MSVDQLPAEPQPSILDEIIADYLEAEDRGVPDDRAAILARHPEWARELTAFFAGQERVGRLVAPLREIASPAEPSAPGRSIGGYEILGEFARGGMGVVYTARQTRLGRVVALKMILSGAHAPAAERRRFQLEAEAAARLDHPNIVPVYDVGEADGLPFYSMKLIAGRNLADHLGGRPLPPLESARLVAAVARAIGYAHDRGVLHRDLKPANILIEDGTGTPHVADFGLARRLADDDRLTPPGYTLGTPAYLAPELLQAAGDRPGQLTTAADVYALGAILYECLTGRPPFRAESPMATLMEIVHNQPPRPRAVAPAVPVDLETVCLKCLDRIPARRYSRAADLADELERWQRGEPVVARPVGPAARFFRWCRRQPVAAALAGGLAVSVVLGLASVYREWRRAEENFQASEVHRQTAEQREQEAEANFRLAHDAVGRFYDTFCERHLKGVPGLKAARREALKDARGYFERFVSQRGQDPGLRHELAAAHFRIAAIDQATGAIAAALPGYEQALAILESLAAEAPNDTKVRCNLARTLQRLATVQLSLRKSEAALTIGQRAQAMYEDLVRLEPDNLDHLVDLAAVLHNLGSQYQGSGQDAEAGRFYEAKVEVCLTLLQQRPDHSDAPVMLARGLQNYAHITSALGRSGGLCLLVPGRDHGARRPPEAPSATQPWPHCARRLAARPGQFLLLAETACQALAALARARPLLDAALAADPEDADILMALSSHHRQLGHAWLIAGDPGQAAKIYNRARQYAEQLTAQHGHAPGCQDELASCLFDLGAAHSRRKDWAAAVQAFQRADIVTKLCLAEPGRDLLRRKLGRTLKNLAVVHRHRQQPDAAVEFYRRAAAAYESAFRIAPRLALNRNGLAGCYAGWAELERLRGRLAAAATVTQLRRAAFANDAAELTATAREFARIADRDAADLTPTEADACRRAADEAVACLRAAAAHGAADYARLREEAVFARLRDRLPVRTPPPATR